MNKYVPIKKLSKRKRREINARRRGSWGGLNPVTRKPKNPKAYSRKKARDWTDDSMTASFSIGLMPVITAGIRCGGFR